jgi:DNA-binding transcriptional ArsR family regulator
MINESVNYTLAVKAYEKPTARDIFPEMVKQTEDTLDATFAALADPTRRRILQRLAVTDATVGELAAPFDVSAPAISRHLRVLEDAGLVSRERDGRVHHLRLEREAMNEALGWIAHWGGFWESRFDALEELLAERER